MVSDEAQRPGAAHGPDPTVLTTQQLLWATATLEKLMAQRFDAMATAAAASEKLVDTKLTALRDVQNEKFESIAQQFREREVRTEQTSRDSKIAVEAALQAAKEAVAKSEVATIKQIDQQGSRIDAVANGLTDKIEDVKGRMNLREGRQAFADPQLESMAAAMKKLEGTIENRGGRASGIEASWGILLGAVGLCGGVIAIGAAILSFLTKG